MAKEHEILNDWGTDLFVRDNIDYYKNKWHNNMTDQTFESWNWAAFFFPGYWLAYRKMYLETFLCTIACLILSIIPLGGVVPRILVGIYGNSYYRKKGLKVIRETFEMTDEEARVHIKKHGGTSIPAIIVTIVILLSAASLGAAGIVFYSIGQSDTYSAQTAFSQVRLADEKTHEVTTKDGLITFTVPHDFIEKYTENQDLNCSSSSRDIGISVFVYRKEDLAENIEEEDLINHLVTNLESYELTPLTDEELPQLEDNMIQKLYFSVDDGIKTYWYIASRKVGDNYAVIFGTALPSTWHEFRDLYGDIVLSARPATESPKKSGGDA